MGRHCNVTIAEFPLELLVYVVSVARGVERMCERERELDIIYVDVILYD